MAIFKAVNLRVGKRKRSNLAGIIKYVLKTEKTEEKLVYGQNLEIPRAYEMMMETKETFGKKKGREYYHYVMSYPPNEKITPEQALEQAKDFLERTKKFRGFETLVAVHKDRKHVHVHFVVNSVNFATGKKFHLSRNELSKLKQLQNEINIEKGFSAAPEKYIGIDGNKRTEIVVNNKNTYQLLAKAEKGQVSSYVQNCAIAVLLNSKKARTQKEFIDFMQEKGFLTSWNENKKHITFTDIEREKSGEKKCKIRLSKLADYYSEFENLSTKEMLENVIKSNNGRTEQTIGTGDVIDFNSGFEEFSHRIDTERAEFAAKENMGPSGRTTASNSQGIQRGNSTISRKNRVSDKFNARDDSEEYSR